MADLPVGTVTLLFTDIEGSTRLLRQLDDRYPDLLAEHHRLLRAAVEARGGRVVDTQGDAFFVAFGRAADAVAAAVEAQRALASHRWPDGAELRVRMGLHTGEPTPAGGGYVGLDLHRGARICAAGHGGQVLLSDAVRALVGRALPDGVGLRDLGEHRLKDLQEPERVFQLVIAGLPSEFPPLRTLEVRPHNLPLQATALLGRAREVAAARERLLREEVRLLTLTGPGGTGKTRLSLHVAAEVIDRFADGVFFVALAPIGDPELVPSTIAQTLGIREAGGRPVLDSLKDHLREKRLLLVLDNFEQILPAAPLIAELLSTSPGLKVLVTSRAPLELRGEHELAVPPLAWPDPKRLPAAEALSRYGAAALFIERATAVKADFAVTNDNAPAVAEICARLDGLPLAIELAAARIRLLSPRAMLARLERRLPLLTGGARDLPARQRTLRDTITWSHDLLDEAERQLFRRLSIFVGGCTLEAAEPVGDPGGELGIDALDGVASLVAKSLLRREDGTGGEPRFGMLETIREFGVEQLEAGGEAGATRGRHAAFFLALAEEAEPMLLGREQLTWLRRLDLEHDNMRAVLGWAREGLIAGEVGLRLAAALLWYWRFRGFVGEGRAWAEAMLALPGAAARTAARARVLLAAAPLAYAQADYPAMRRLVPESAAIFRDLGELRGVGRSLTLLGVADMNERDSAAARSLLDEGAAIAREVDDRWGLAFALTNLGAVAQGEGDYAASRTFREESASIARAIGDRFTLGQALAGLALVARLQGRHQESAALFKETLALSSELENPWSVLRALASLAGTAGLAGDPERAARLFGAVEALREADGTSDSPSWRAITDRDAADVRAALGDEAFAAAWAEGRTMSLNQAVAYALSDSAPN